MRFKLQDGAYEPVRAYKDDAGIDLRTPCDVTIPAHGWATIDTGVCMEIDSGYYGRLEGKSGLHVNHNIVCHGGIIDAQYRGSVRAKLYNHGYKDYHFNAGDKICQLIIQKCELVDIEIVDSLEDTERGVRGFGSSGK